MLARPTIQLHRAAPASECARFGGLAAASHLRKVAICEGQLRTLFFGRCLASPPFCRKERFLEKQGIHASSSSQEPRYKALTVDIGGTFLKTSVPVAEAYAEIGKKYGVTATPDDIKKGFKAAFAKPWPDRLRYEGDGRPFWRHAVATATGCDNTDYFEELYLHYSRGDAWKVEDGAEEALSKLKAAGVKLGVVSNFDTRLRPVLDDLGVSDLFDAIIVSAEVGHEKPATEIFQAALSALSISRSSEAAHIGDDRTADVDGAKAAGMQAWLWKEDVKTFDELVRLIL
ncbi:Haloacid dehalogenase-like hydrolase superfamily protein [Klebsormidium nitens]|uniref:Haloacid dehalogenase-like hydrolase superfamily protein n=1 Tax=Klebsormidium nitens TaxID=105231 RepID=A0A0U9I6A1_KLENI|nr:Haloacid dehalogenase-like hydrolase superfamily protein [Klebsormidium nitens]|eukprot:GAQ77940.1 Haloacid dehalogenase-like hydrolase superfamily protein [Klebsormidium nitens]